MKRVIGYIRTSTENQNLEQNVTVIVPTLPEQSKMTSFVLERIKEKDTHLNRCRKVSIWKNGKYKESP